MTNEPDVRVSYGVKELLSRIDARLESIDNKLDSKADLREFVDLKNAFEALKQKYEKRDAAQAGVAKREQASFSKREKAIGLFLAAMAVVSQPVFQHFHL